MSYSGSQRHNNPETLHGLKANTVVEADIPQWIRITGDITVNDFVDNRRYGYRKIVEGKSKS